MFSLYNKMKKITLILLILFTITRLSFSAEITDTKKIIRDKIEQVIKYPHNAIFMHQEGIYIVHFTIYEDGSVHDLVFQKGRFSLLKQAIIDAINTVAPYPIHKMKTRYALTVDYRLGWARYSIIYR